MEDFKIFSQSASLLLCHFIARGKKMSHSTCKRPRDFSTFSDFIFDLSALPSFLLCLCFKTSLSAKPFIWKWVLHAVSFSCKSKVILIRMVSQFDSLWNRGTRELGNGLLDRVEYNWGSNRASNFKIGRARSARPIWNYYEHDYSLSCTTRGPITN